MKLRLLSLIAAILALHSSAVAQKSAKDYIGWWGTGKVLEMIIDENTFTFQDRGMSAVTVNYTDITPAGSNLYHLVFRKPIAVIDSSKFMSIAIGPAGEKDRLTMTHYKSLADMKAKRNPQGDQEWIRNNPPEGASGSDTVSGTLQVGKQRSVILYFGEESGDYAGYCFENKSEAGTRILAAVKNGEKCELVGTIDNEAKCKVPGLEADLSASGKIVSVQSVKVLKKQKAR
jgi:hypothetical protein